MNYDGTGVDFVEKRRLMTDVNFKIEFKNLKYL